MQFLFDVAFDRSPIGMALFNMAGEYTRVNDALCRMLRRSAGELIGRRDQELTHPDDRQTDLDACELIFAGEMDTFQTEKRFVLPGGEVVWTLANLTFVRDPFGEPVSWVGQFQDITARREAEAQLVRLAQHDPLTGLVNRRRFEEELGTTIRQVARHHRDAALIVVDLDGFKRVNDEEGHVAGDRVLNAVAGVLRERVRGDDVVARLGGDEFAVILREAAPADAELVAAEIAATAAGRRSAATRLPRRAAAASPPRRSRPSARGARACCQAARRATCRSS